MIDRAARLALVPLLLAATVLGGAPAVAQDGAVQLRLSAQTPWATPRQPIMRLGVEVTNGTDLDLQDAVLRVTVSEPVLSRSELRLAMDSETGAALSTVTLPVNDIGAGDTALVQHRFRVGYLEQVADEARVYPVLAEVAPDAEGTALASLRTALVFLPDQPEEPLNLAWTFVLGHPIDFGPDGVFLGRSLERRLAPDGSLSGAAGALGAMLSSPGEQVPVDVVLSPTLLEDLRRMRRGYEGLTGAGAVRVPAGEGAAADAQQVLEQLRTIVAARWTEFSTMPYAVPDLPQLIGSGLGGDLPQQLALGRRRSGEILGSVGGGFADAGEPTVPPPVAELLRPPGSSLDQPTLQALRKEGVTTLLLDEGVVVQPRQTNDFAPPMGAAIAPGIQAVVPDEGLQSLIADPLAHDDPHLAAQWLIADLASIWLEQPDTPRAVAMIVSGEQTLSPPFFDPLVRGVQFAPWLRPTKATNLLRRFPPVGPPDRVRFRGDGPMPAGYVAAIERDRQLIGQLREILVGGAATAVPAALLRDLLLTEGGAMVDRRELGEAWLADVERRVQERFAQIGADTAQVVTLTSSGGRIPVRVTNRGDLPVRVRVELRSSRLRFPGGSARTQELAPGQTSVVIFDATAQTTGTFPVQVAVTTPSGAVLSEDQIVVRSTAFNVFALLITAGAMLVLLLIWGRRHLSPKRR